MKPCSLIAECFVLVQVLRVNSHSQSPKRTLFVCRHGERMDVVFGKHWLSQCSDAKGSGTYTTHTNIHKDEEWLQSNLVFLQADMCEVTWTCPLFCLHGVEAGIMTWTLLSQCLEQYRPGLWVCTALYSFFFSKQFREALSVWMCVAGEALLENNTNIDFVYCSPSLRCVQTAHEILKGN